MIQPLSDALWRAEREHLEKALTIECTAKERARLLGISIRKLYYRMKAHGLAKPMPMSS